MNTYFYLSKGNKTVGPCTLDDVRNFLAYGSVKPTDLVRRDGDPAWTPLQQLRELFQQDPAELKCVPNMTHRRRTARYRDYLRVPNECRSGWVLRYLILGFLFFPPKLWRGALSVYQGKVFRKTANEDGYLLTWPRRMEVVVTALVLVNALAWGWGLLWLSDHWAPFGRELLSMFRTAISDLQDWLGQH